MDPLKSMCRAVKERGKKWCEWGGESDTFTPSCQFACGPLSLHYPVLSLLHRPPTRFSCLVFRLWNLSQGRPCHQGWKTGEGREEGMRIEVGKDLGVEMWRQMERCHHTGRWIALKYCIIHQNLNDVSGLSRPIINTTRDDKNQTKIFITSLFFISLKIFFTS